MMDCSHSMAGEKMVGQSGGFSYTASAKKDMSSVKLLKLHPLDGILCQR